MIIFRKTGFSKVNLSFRNVWCVINYNVFAIMLKITLMPIDIRKYMDYQYLKEF